MIDDLTRTTIQARLLHWYARAHRPLPWRDTRDPYAILVSEVMLQQTQAERVIPKYHAFLEQFPTLHSLAAASPADVLRAWSGLGYNRRALNLQRTALAAVERHGGSLPSDVADLLALPGIGPYTAGAIACFAFGQDVAFIDTNIRRVLHRVLVGPDLPERSASEREMVELATAMVPAGSGYAWNQALMELGATICRARVAECLHCPLREVCQSAGRITALAAQAAQAAQSAQAGAKRSAPAPRFEETARFARGRIIATLGEHTGDGLSVAELAAHIRGNDSEVEREWVEAQLPRLLTEGLLQLVPASASAPERFRLPTSIDVQPA